MMNAFPGKDQYLATLRATHTEWETLLAEVGEARMTEPGVAGAWSVKDIVAHVTWGEREMLGVFQAHALVGSDLWQRALDDRNNAVYLENRDRPLQSVLNDAHAVYAQLLHTLESAPKEDLTDARRFRDMPEDWVPWQVFAGNTFLHYQDHMATIRAWLAGRGAK